ncbi:hypothetical protein K525DRAFT_275634 [Schizophyllum commune Loenen D]|nr:hypothetical protein K525DRAFT_275634 [Schizophyllum commune Loenen D]
MAGGPTPPSFVPTFISTDHPWAFVLFILATHALLAGSKAIPAYLHPVMRPRPIYSTKWTRRRCRLPASPTFVFTSRTRDSSPMRVYPADCTPHTSRHASMLSARLTRILTVEAVNRSAYISRDRENAVIALSIPSPAASSRHPSLRLLRHLARHRN